MSQPDENVDHRIGQTGKLRGRSFKIIGHINFRDHDIDDYDEWNEWIIQFDDHSLGFLVQEDDKYQLFAPRNKSIRPIPNLETAKAGNQLNVEGFDSHVEAVGTAIIRSFAGQLPDHPLPQTVLTYLDCTVRNYIVTVEHTADFVHVHFGIDLKAEEIQFDQ